jgi:D-sedoheptulose 7-phosphate isomerase
MSEYLESQVSSLMNLWGNKDTYPTSKIRELGDKIIKCFQTGGLLAFAGNGGSSAEASHLAAEFTGRCVKDHHPLPALNLGESVAAFSAATNDYSFENSLVRSSQALLNSKSILIALSTSGTSLNITKLLNDATGRGIYTVLWTGSKFKLDQDANSREIWKVDSTITPRVQEVHLMWGHLLSEYVESTLA